MAIEPRCCVWDVGFRAIGLVTDYKIINRYSIFTNITVGVVNVSPVTR